ncbi:heavy metal translocating P-type ATPase [Halorubraceae archaeon YAN]|nr:heavy metal translocating P-type ATPase [Halorubraceae archaeon YAN]
MSMQSTDNETVQFVVPDMDCPSCAGKVERGLGNLDAILDVETRPTSGTVVVTYDATSITAETITEALGSLGYPVTTTQQERFSVPSMDCSACAGKVDAALNELSGVVSIDTRPTSGTVVVTYDPAQSSVGELAATIEQTGYAVVESKRDTQPQLWKTPRAVKTAIGAVLLLTGVVFEWFIPAFNTTFTTIWLWTVSIDWLLYVLAVVVAGTAILRNGLISVRTRQLDIDLLMSAGITGALVVGLPFEAATLAVLYSIAELLERYSIDRARNSLTELLELSPDTATVRRNGEEVVVPVEEISVGETVVVRPGENVPLDGVVIDGHSALDESPVTGESVPVDKTVGDEVYAGTRNTEGFLAIEATAPAGESTLAQVIELVADAEAEQTEREQFVDRFAAIYTPIIVVGALLTMTIPPLVFGAPFTEWFVRGLTLIVIACPCAFVISTPVSVVSGLTSAARNGVLIKGGAHLESMATVDTVALDKTGTLTTGELQVTDVIALNGNDETDVLACAGSIERRSEHPIAAAIVEYADTAAAPIRSIAQFEALPGKGVRAELDGVTHYAGKPGLFAELGFSLEHTHLKTDGGVTISKTAEDDIQSCAHGSYLDLRNETIPRLQQEGKTVILVGTEDEIEGVIAVADTVRPEAAWMVDRLHELGISRVVMLTGDNERTAHAIGNQVGVDEIRAGLLPAEKVAAIRELDAETAGGVAMVGDGINDAPALATATVGIAMGAAGTDAAIETADIALMADDLTKLPYLYSLSAKSESVIKQNIGSSLAVKAVLAIGAPFGYVSVLVAIVVGDMGMSLGVTSNAMRLAGIEPETPPEAIESV